MSDTECPICSEKLPHASGETGQQCDRDIERNRIALELAERELTYDTRATPILRELARLRAVEETVRELRAWQLAVADGLGFANRAEGQSGYEVAKASVIVAYVKGAEHDGNIETVCELREWLEQERVVIKQLRNANALYRADVADLRAERERLTAELKRLAAWQLAVADGLGFANRAEGQSGYEVARPAVIVAYVKGAERDGNIETVHALRDDVDALTAELDLESALVGQLQDALSAAQVAHHETAQERDRLRAGLEDVRSQLHKHQGHVGSRVHKFIDMCDAALAAKPEGA